MSSLSRRQFVVAGIRGLGAWLVGASAAKKILQLATENDQPYLVEVDDPVCELWANFVEGDYLFTLGCPLDDEKEPQLTWRNWLEIKEVDVSSGQAVRQFCEEWGLYHPEAGEPYLAPVLDARLPNDLLQNYLHWEYALHDDPAAQAYHYLSGISLANRRLQGDPLGSLDFVQGPYPGNNSTFVTTSEVETLGGLQQRLLQLGHRVRIREA